ncbi:MAG: histidine phosphatase family protein [Cyclobacteriaceae bacterium]
MVRKIFLLRHGEAIYPEQGMDDMERSLTSKGSTQIRTLGAKMGDAGFDVDLTYCSSSDRTRQTFQHLSEALKKNLEVEFREDIYEASVRTLFELLCESDKNLMSILLIGHNPGITYLAEYLSGEIVGNMLPGQLVKLEFGMGDWSQLSQGSCGVVN